MALTEGLSTGWLETVLRGLGRDNSVRVFEVSSEAAAAAGDNYASAPTRLTVQMMLGSGKNERRRFVLKRRIIPPGPFALLSLRVFNNESAFYRHVVPAMLSITRGTVLSGENFWPDCYFSDSSHILMEDLKESGYITADRLKGLSVEQSSGALRSLARLHALSLVAVRRGMCPQILTSNLFLTSHLSDYVFSQIEAFSLAVEQVWGPEWSNLSEKVKKSAETFQEKMRALDREESDFRVVTHGDPWTTNFMFYNNGSNCKTKLVDYQLACMGTPGWDLNYVLHSSVDPSLLVDQIDNFLTVYTQEFADVLQAVGEDPKTGPSLEQVRMDFDRTAPWGFFIAVTFAPVILCEKEDIPSTEDLFVPEKTLVLYKKPKFVQFMKASIPRFLKLNAI